MHIHLGDYGWPIVLLLCLALLSGCGGRTSDDSRTSHEEITAFLQENPEYAEPTTPQSERAPLGLER